MKLVYYGSQIDIYELFLSLATFVHLLIIHNLYNVTNNCLTYCFHHISLLSFFYFSQVCSPLEDHESYNISNQFKKKTDSEPPHQAPSENEINSRPSESCIFAQKKKHTNTIIREPSPIISRAAEQVFWKEEVSSISIRTSIVVEMVDRSSPRIGCVSGLPSETKNSSPWIC